jgi:hypothetical protein
VKRISSKFAALINIPGDVNKLLTICFARNPNNFIPFDKSCINAKKTISKKLIEDHKNTFIKTYGVNSDYILDNYTESER